MNNLTFRALILVMMIGELSGKISDMETVFLHRELKEEIFIECPPGMDTKNDDEILILDQCIYGLVQSARQYHKKAFKILRDIGFEGGEVNSCLYVQESTKFGRVYIALYVDDNLIFWKEEAISEVIQELKNKTFTLKNDGDIKDYLSCKIEFSENKKSVWLG